MGNKVICISRCCGSGGHLIGEAVAEKLGIKYYDRNLLDMALEHGGLTGVKGFDKVDEKAPNPAFYKLRYEGNENVESERPAHDMVHQLQRDMILKVAEEGDCVIVGRCAGPVLDKAGIPHASVFITASNSYCVKEIMKRDNLNKVQAGIQVKRVNKRREDFVYHYTKRDWTDQNSYQMVLNSEKLGFDRCVEMLCNHYEHIL